MSKVKWDHICAISQIAVILIDSLIKKFRYRPHYFKDSQILEVLKVVEVTVDEGVEEGRIGFKLEGWFEEIHFGSRLDVLTHESIRADKHFQEWAARILQKIINGQVALHEELGDGRSNEICDYIKTLFETPV